MYLGSQKIKSKPEKGANIREQFDAPFTSHGTYVHLSFVALLLSVRNKAG